MDDPDLAAHLLRMCSIKWQTVQFDQEYNSGQFKSPTVCSREHREQCRIGLQVSKPEQVKRGLRDRIPKNPKKVGWTNKHYVHCKKHGGAFKSHNTHNCCCFDKDGTLTKGYGGTGRPQMEKKCKGMNFAQIMHAELKRALHKHCAKVKNSVITAQTVIATPMKVAEGVGCIALGNLICVRSIN